MANVCSCCGKKIPFLDVEFDYIEIDNISDATHEKVVDYLRNIKSDEKIEHEKKEKEQIESKKVAQRNNPLYDDIHQIAGDLRFIKNLIIFGLVCGVVLGIIGVFGML